MGVPIFDILLKLLYKLEMVCTFQFRALVKPSDLLGHPFRFLVLFPVKFLLLGQKTSALFGHLLVPLIHFGKFLLFGGKGVV